MRIYFFLLIYCLGSLHFIQAQDELKTPVVVVKSIEADGYEEIGTGILIGQQGNNLFILTAAHVIKNPQQVYVQFLGTYDFVSADHIRSSSAYWDLSILKCTKPSTYQVPQSFRFANQPPTFRQPLTIIGHPGGEYWDLNIRNAIKGTSYESDDRLFTTTPQGIIGGNSGGPILNEKNELLGIVQKTDSRKAVGISAAAIQNILTDWRIPMNLLSGVASTTSAGNNQPVSNIPQDYTDPLIGDMVYVEGGSFTMGSNDGGSDEKPPHTVKVSSFYIGRYEITQAQWMQIMGNNPSYFKDCDKCPVEAISWDDAKDFIKKLNQKSNYTYRLLTEAEWEYAARGGKNKDSYIYAGSNSADDVAWYGDINGKTHPVGEKKANSLGIYDMSGNVWEWCEDWYHDSYKNAPSDGSAWLSPTGSYRLLRGGSWYDFASIVRVAFRDGNTPGLRLDLIGVRLARTP